MPPGRFVEPCLVDDTLERVAGRDDKAVLRLQLLLVSGDQQCVAIARGQEKRLFVLPAQRQQAGRDDLVVAIHKQLQS